MEDISQHVLDRLDFLEWLIQNPAARPLPEGWFLAVIDLDPDDTYPHDVYGDVHHRDGRHFTVLAKRAAIPIPALESAAKTVIRGADTPFPVIPRRDD